MSDITDFFQLSMEERHDDDVNRLKYNIATNSDTKKEYFSKTKKK